MCRTMAWPGVCSLLLSLTFLSIVSSQDTVTLSAEPGDGITLGGTITYTCTVAMSNSQNPVVWLRKTGSIWLEIAESNILQGSLASTGRYSIVPSMDADGNAKHQLILNDAKYEDGAEIGCRLLGSADVPPFVAVAVCDDLSKDWCQCAQQRGWPDPECFDRPKSAEELEASYNRTVTGLGVCLAITFIYGIILSLVAGCDCMKKMHLKRKRAEAVRQAQANRRHNPYGDSEVLEIDPNEGVYSEVSSQEASKLNSAPVQDHQYRPHRHGPQENHAFENDLYAAKSPTRANRDTADAAAMGATGPDPNIDFRMPSRRTGSRENLDQPPEYDRLPVRNGYAEPVTHGARGMGQDRTPSGYYRDQEGTPGGYGRSQNNAPSAYDRNSPYNMAPSGGAKPRDYAAPYKEEKSPGGWSTQSAKLPSHDYNHDYYNSPSQSHNNARNALSERPSRDNRNHQRTGEPRRLDFVETSAPMERNRYNGYAENLDGPYVDNTNTVV